MELGDMRPNEPLVAASTAALGDLKAVSSKWQVALSKDLVAFNELLVKYKLKPIEIPTTKK